MNHILISYNKHGIWQSQAIREISRNIFEYKRRQLFLGNKRQITVSHANQVTSVYTPHHPSVKKKITRTGTVYLKIKVLSLFTHPHVSLHPYDLLYSIENFKRDHVHVTLSYSGVCNVCTVQLLHRGNVNTINTYLCSYNPSLESFVWGIDGNRNLYL